MGMSRWFHLWLAQIEIRKEEPGGDSKVIKGHKKAEMRAKSVKTLVQLTKV